MNSQKIYQTISPAKQAGTGTVRRKAWPVAWATLVGLLLAGAVGAAQTEERTLTVSVGASEVVEVPFEITGFSLVDRNVVSVSQLPGSRKVQIAGKVPGSTDLLLTGAGVEQVIKITVVENIDDVMRAVMKDLNAVPEVELSVNLGRVVVKGEVSSIANWELLCKVLAMYGGKVVNLAVFRPAPEVLAQLNDSLTKAGFEVVGPEEELAPNQVRLRFSGNMIILSARFYSAADERRLRGVAQSHPWLVVVDNMEKAGEIKQEDPRVRLVMQVEIIPTMLDLEVAFVGISDNEYRQAGVNLAKAGLMVIDTTAAAFRGTVGPNSSGEFSGSYSINSGLQGALSFFQGDGPGRFIQRGHLTFKNDTQDWSSYQSGGTLKVRVATAQAVGLEDINYGLMISIKGGLVDPNNVSLDMNLELSYPLPVGTDYDLKRNTLHASASCPLGQTLVVGGMKGLIEKTSTEGVPYLRSIPLLKWLFSEQEKGKEQYQVLIMISPSLAGTPRPSATPSLTSESKQTEAEAAKPVEEREKEKRGNSFLWR